MANIKFNKVTTLPATLEADSFYFVANGSYAESYVTDSTGVARTIGNSEMINALIETALANWNTSTVEIVADIATRDALIAGLTISTMIMVVDASADTTVTSGSALYAFNASDSAVHKISEYESMDVVIQWSAIQNGPASTPTQIDEAVSQRHSHANKATLDKFSEDVDGALFNGAAIDPRWKTTNW